MNTNTITPAAPCPHETEHRGSLVMIRKHIEPGTSVKGLGELVSSGKIASYSQKGEELVVYASSEDTARIIDSLDVEKKVNHGGNILAKLKEIFIPPEIEENCASEYLRYRGWQLASAVCAGALGFMTAQVSLDAIKIAFSNSEKAALAGVINGTIGKFICMGGSFLASKGDRDPKKFALMSSLIVAGNAIATLGTLALMPQAYVALTAITGITGALAFILGSAADVNIFNHMAKGPAKGLVASKNNNQNMVAEMCGMPLAMGMSRIASHLSVNPYVFTAAILGPLLAFTTVKAASSIRMEAISQANLEKIADHYIENNEILEAEHRGIAGAFKSLFSSDSHEFSKRITFVNSLEAVVGEEDSAAHTDRLFGLFKNENYILNCHSNNTITILFKKKATVDDITRAYIQARLIERGLDSALADQLKKLYGDDSLQALVDLSYRALPASFKITDELAGKGWNIGEAKFNLNRTDTEWTGPDHIHPESLTITMLKSMLTTPSAQKLEALLGGEYGSKQYSTGRATKEARLLLKPQCPIGHPFKVPKYLNTAA
jgi:hypothetical protein